MKIHGLWVMAGIIFLAVAARSQGPEIALSFPRDDSLQMVHDWQAGRSLERSQPDSAVYYYRRALRGADRIKDAGMVGDVYLRLFTLFFQSSRYAEAFDLAQDEVAAGRARHDRRLQMRGINNLAIAYQFLNDYQTAADYYLQAARLAGEMNDQAIEAKIMDNMSSLFLKLKNYENAYTYGLKSYQLSVLRRDSLYIISGLISMADAQGGLGHYDTALHHLAEAETIAIGQKAMMKLVLIKENKGIVNAEAGRPVLAAKAFREAVALARQYHYPLLVATALNGLANSEAHQGRYRNAERYAREAIGIAEQEKLGSDLADMYNIMADIQQKLGNLPEALSYKARYEKLNDSLMNAQVKTSILRMNLQYHTAEKDKEILAQKLQLAQNESAIRYRNGWLVASLILFLALAVILGISVRNYQHKKKLHAQTLLALRREQEVVRLKALMQGKDEERSRISREMHDDIGSGLTSILFLSNQLNGSQASDRQQAGRKIARHANLLISKMNEIIWSMNTDYDLLEDLVAYIRYHASELLESSPLRYHFDIPEYIPDIPLSGEQRRNIYLVVKEALHNVIKHAQAKEVVLTFRFDPEISIVVKDDGHNPEAGTSHRFGNGLRNMQQRMESIGGTWRIETDKGTVVTLSLPLPR
jgi:signal transduction histidine kinase